MCITHSRIRKKECIISRIEASQDGSPYVYVTFSDPNDYKPGAEKPQNPFGMNMMAITSPEDLMKNLPKGRDQLYPPLSLLQSRGHSVPDQEANRSQ
jgi:hypothetical protein